MRFGPIITINIWFSIRIREWDRRGHLGMDPVIQSWWSALQWMVLRRILHMKPPSWSAQWGLRLARSGCKVPSCAHRWPGVLADWYLPSSLKDRQSSSPLRPCKNQPFNCTWIWCTPFGRTLWGSASVPCQPYYIHVIYGGTHCMFGWAEKYVVPLDWLVGSPLIPD